MTCPGESTEDEDVRGPTEGIGVCVLDDGATTDLRGLQVGLSVDE